LDVFGVFHRNQERFRALILANQHRLLYFYINSVIVEILTIDQIKLQYPDQWVLVGNPELDDPNTLGSVVSKLLRGIVLYASKDKRELAYKAKEVKGDVSRTACIYTGQLPARRRIGLLQKVNL
jgi:hypothetical protein